MRWTKATARRCSSTTASSACLASKRSAIQVRRPATHCTPHGLGQGRQPGAGADAPGGQALDELLARGRMPWGRGLEAEQGVLGRTPGALAWLCRGPSPWRPHPVPMTLAKWCPHCGGLHGLGTGGVSLEGGCVWVALGTEGLPCGARGKKSSRHVGSCQQAVTAMVTGFLRPVRRWAGPGLQSELRGPNSNRRARSGRPGMGRLDCAQAGWISWALPVTTTAFGHSGEQESGQSLL